MGTSSKIEWTDATWNVAVGCRKVDADCKFCYMYRDSLNGTRYNPKQIRKTKTVFDLPLRIKEPSKIFTSSLTDFFIEDIDEYRNEAWRIIKQCPHHTFQILTKRPERISFYHEKTEIGMRTIYRNMKNVWIGTSIGSQDSMSRMYSLIHSGWRGVKFISFEPLHGPIDMDRHLCDKCGEPVYLHGIDWVIIGGESGNDNGKYRYRPCKIEWIEKIIEQCKSAGIPVFVKQLGTHLSKELGLKDRHGKNIDEWPEHLRIREFPKP